MPIHSDDRHRYPPPASWAALRHRLLERAGYQCECDGRCGRPHRSRCVEQHLEPAVTGGVGVRVVLTIAHLDHTPENNADENLMAMCQGCHLHYDIEHHQQSMLARQLRALEAAGQLTLTDPPLRAVKPIEPLVDAAEIERRVVTARDDPATRETANASPPAELERHYSVRALPPELLSWLVAAHVAEQHATDVRAAARGELAAACAAAIDAGAQVNELAHAVAGSRPRLYRLLAEHQEARHAA